MDNSFDIVVIGGGLAGLYALHRMRQLGLKTVVLEAGPDIGGTWYWNKYPGARCDIESLEYSFSFSEELQQDWRWSERYASQAELLAYINHVAERFDMRQDIVVNSTVSEMRFDDAHNSWLVTTADGTRRTARFCIMATGNLSIPQYPDIAGLDEFKGETYHSGKWPSEAVDFTGKRVAVIGTGSSGIQIITTIARQVKRLLVFQRTANFSVPANNRLLTDAEDEIWKRDYPNRRKASRWAPSGVGSHPRVARSLLDDDRDARDARLEEAWAHGGNLTFLETYNDIMTNGESNRLASEFIRNKIQSIVADPSVAGMLTPTDHPVGSKRLCVDTGYYQVFNQPNVELVDLKQTPIHEIRPRGVLFGAREEEVDAIIFATGYDAITGALSRIDIKNGQDRTLSDRWLEGPLTYLGLMVPGFPNMFLVTGPGSPSVKAQMIIGIEQHVDLVARCLEHSLAHGGSRIDVSEDHSAKWGEHVDAVAGRTLFADSRSWYTGANMAGKRIKFLPYIGGHGNYRRICEDMVAAGWDGFEFELSEARASLPDRADA